jgi:hypothetical protein
MFTIKKSRLLPTTTNKTLHKFTATKNILPIFKYHLEVAKQQGDTRSIEQLEAE